MKRAKIMLTAVAVLAVVGGALAFKANTKFTKTYCILTTVNNPSGGTCTGQFVNSKTSTTGSRYWYIEKPTGQNCNTQSCLVSTSIVAE